MKLYNSLTKQIEEFMPQKDGEVTIYSCGPTLYNRVQLGNMLAFISADSLKRTLKISFSRSQS